MFCRIRARDFFRLERVEGGRFGGQDLQSVGGLLSARVEIPI